MPYKPDQMRAIAADMKRRGKSDQEISAFFHKHGKAKAKKDLAGKLRGKKGSS
jgi:hypothetical protein